MKNYIIALGVVALVVLGIAGLRYPIQIQSFGAVSAVNTVANTAKLATINMVPSTASATTTSILNPDSSDREISSSVVSCTGVGTSQTPLTGTGLAALTVQMSTSSTASINATGNTNYAANLIVSTSSSYSFQSSTTEPVSSSVSRLWPAGTYLNISFNATNTAICTVGVHYLAL